MKRRVFTLLLCLTLLLGTVTPVAAAKQPEEEDLILVMVNVYSNRTGTNPLKGLYYDNIFYLPAAEIARMAGADLTEADKDSVTFSMYDGIRQITVTKDGTITEISGKLKQINHLSAVSYKNTVYISAVDMLTYMGATVGFGEDETAQLHMMVTMPYTVQELFSEYIEYGGYHFSWAEANGKWVDPESVKELAALDTIVLGYDSNIMAYGLWGYAENLEKTIHADALLEIMRTEGEELVSYEDPSVEILNYLDDNTEVSFTWLQETMDWAAEIDADKALAKAWSSKMDAAGLVVDMTAGCISSLETAKQFANLSTTQKVLMERTLCRVSSKSDLYKQHPMMFEAARDAHGLMTGAYSAGEKAAWDSMYNLMSNAVDAITPPNPVSLAWDVLTGVAKLDPLVGSLLEAEANITFACESNDVRLLAWSLMELDAEKMDQNNGYLGSKDTSTVENLKYDMILSLKASLTTRLLLLDTGWLTEEAQSAMQAKASGTARLLNKAQNARAIPVGILERNEEDISWIEKLACAGGYGQVVHVGGNTYYWRYSSGSFRDVGVVDFAVNYTSNNMICRDAKGKETVLFTLEGQGKFVVANGYLFYQNTAHEICSIRLDGTEEKNWGMGYLLGVTEDGSRIFCTDSSNEVIQTIDLEADKRSRFASGSFVTCYDGVIYYTREVNYEEGQMGKVDLWRIHVDGTGNKRVYTTGTDLYDYYGANSVAMIDQMRFTEDYIYFSYCSIGGTGLMSQGGRVIRVRYDGTGAEVMAGEKELIYGTFSVNSDGSVSVAGENAVYYDLGSLFQVVDGSVYHYPQTEGFPEKIIGTADYSAVGKGLLGQRSDDGSILLLSFVEVHDEKVYYMVHYAVDNPDTAISWRESYKRVKSALLVKDLETGKVTVLYKF